MKIEEIVEKVKNESQVNLTFWIDYINNKPIFATATILFPKEYNAEKRKKILLHILQQCSVTMVTVGCHHYINKKLGKFIIKPCEECENV